jgi:hypothetical protein
LFTRVHRPGDTFRSAYYAPNETPSATLKIPCVDECVAIDSTQSSRVCEFARRTTLIPQ